VDVAVPALQAIFSDGSAPNSAPQERLDQPSNIINLERSDNAIHQILAKSQDFPDPSAHKIEDAAKQLGKWRWMSKNVYGMISFNY
jgi:hypothetical protein